MVPPFALTVAVPSVPALQLTLVLVTVDVNAAGSFTVVFAVVEHPLASVMVTVYVPADRLFAAAPVPPDGDQP